MKYAKLFLLKHHKSFQTLTNLQPTENPMNKFQSILALIVFIAFIKGLFALTNPEKPTGTVTIVHEGVEIVYVQDESFALRAER